MPAIDALLPLIDDSDSWRWNTQSETNSVVGAGSNKTVYESSTDIGWFYWGLITIRGEKGPNTTIDITSGRLSVDSTIAEFYANGVTARGAGAPSINRYDTQDDIYGVLYEPRPPLAFTQDLTITVEGAANDDVTVTSDMLELEILDEKSFKDELRETVFAGVNENLEEIVSTFDTMSAQIAQTNNLLGSLIRQDQVTEITQGGTVGDEDAESIAEEVGSIIDTSDQPTGSTANGEKDRDGDLTTLGE